MREPPKKASNTVLAHPSRQMCALFLFFSLSLNSLTDPKHCRTSAVSSPNLALSVTAMCEELMWTLMKLKWLCMS